MRLLSAKVNPVNTVPVNVPEGISELILTTNASYDPRPSLVVHPQQMILLLESIIILMNASSPVPP